jgi:hypothetical protein
VSLNWVAGLAGDQLVGTIAHGESVMLVFSVSVATKWSIPVVVA